MTNKNVLTVVKYYYAVILKEDGMKNYLNLMETENLYHKIFTTRVETKSKIVRFWSSFLPECLTLSIDNRNRLR